MLVRVTFRGEVREVRSTASRVVLGHGPGADVSLPEAGWAPTEAILHHAGTDVRLERPGGEALRLRVGDEVRLGRARVSLLGLLPREADAPAAPGAPALFGGYEIDQPAGAPFHLVDELGPSRGDRPTRAAPPPPARTGGAPAGPARRGPDRVAGSRPAAEASRPASPASPPAPATTGGGSPAAAPAPRPEPETRGRVPLPRPAAHAFGETSFGEEMVRQLRRAPYLTLSVAFHVLVVVVLALVQSHAPRPETERGPLVARLVEPRLLEAPEVLPEVEKVPSIPDPSPAEVADPEPPTPPPIEEPRPEPKDERLDALEDGTVAPLRVGVAPSLSAIDADRAKRAPKPAKVDLARAFGKADRDVVNRQVADMIRSELGVGSGGRGDPLGTLARHDILVVTGDWDRIGSVLEALRLPFETTTPVRFARDGGDLHRCKIIFWNCGNALEPVLLAQAARRVRAFVKNGGYLFTSDWCVGNLLMFAFPGLLATQGQWNPMPEMVIGIRPAKGAIGDPLLDGVFHPGVEGRWWLENTSFDVQVNDTEKVKVLIESPELASRLRRSSAVAVTFPYGKGRVLHIAGHYYQEEGNLAGTISAHRLAMNFVLERLAEGTDRRR